MNNRTLDATPTAACCFIVTAGSADAQGHNRDRGNGDRGRNPAGRPDINDSIPPVLHLPPNDDRRQPGVSLDFGFPL